MTFTTAILGMYRGVATVVGSRVGACLASACQPMVYRGLEPEQHDSPLKVSAVLELQSLHRSHMHATASLAQLLASSSMV